MLVLTRKKGEAIVIGDNIRIVVCGIEDGKIRLGIEAPREIEILREEIHISNQETNTLIRAA